MMTANIDTTGFTENIRKFVSVLGLDSVKVIRKEMGQLIKTLVRQTPAAKNIEQSIRGKFDAANNGMSGRTSRMADMLEKSGNNSTIWYAWSPTALYGVARNLDKTQASVSELEAINRTLTQETAKSRTRQRVGQRGKQTVFISQKILTMPGTLAKMIQVVKSHRGRLKAGWLAAWFEGKVELSGAQPPAYVTRHRGAISGRVVDELSNTDSPALTIANSARGVDKKEVKSIAQLAVNIRAKAMADNFRLLFSGKKYLSDYAK